MIKSACDLPGIFTLRVVTFLMGFSAGRVGSSN